MDPAVSSRASRHAGLLYMLVTTLGWGIAWPVMKGLLAVWPPLSARGWAGLAGGAGLALVAVLRGESFAIPRHALGPLLLAASFNVTAWMGLGTLSMLWLSVAEGAMLAYTVPIWVMLLAWPMLGGRPAARDFAALAIGVCGIVVLLGKQGFALEPSKLHGVALVLMAASMFALGLVRLRLPLGMPATAAVAWQVGLGCVPIVMAGVLFERPSLRSLTPQGWASLVYMAAVPMGLCYLTWFTSLRRLPPSTAAMASLLTPLVGVVAAAVALSAPIGPREILALGLILGGVTLSLRSRRR